MATDNTFLNLRKNSSEFSAGANIRINVPEFLKRLFNISFTEIDQVMLNI